MTAPITAAPLFSLVEAHEADALERLFHAVMLEPDQVLFEQGRPCDWLWVLGPGAEVSVTSAGDSPAQVQVAHLSAGDTVGEMALVDEGPRSGTARVTVGGPASVMAARDFYALRDAYHPAAFQLLRKICLELCTRLRGTTDRLVPPTGAGGSEVAPLPLDRVDPEHLDAVPSFRGLPRVVKLALAQKLARVELPPGNPVCFEGQEGDAAYFIASGEVEVVRGDHTLAHLGPGEVFGMVALMDGGPRSATCVTATPTRLFRLARADFEQLFASGNRFAFQLVDGMARQLVRNLRTADLLLARPEASVQPLAVSGELFSTDELALLELGDLADPPGTPPPPA
ncbi:MAG TPA: cyclic nucleotide-binding domain-containing protein [Myxococcaceae bacterium]|nr:cyclic nucleotide-binding domain-containing protein [Myxococcaceae bacterium]